MPDKPNDLSGVLTTALGIYGQVNSQITEAPAPAAPAASAAPAARPKPAAKN